MRKENSKRRIKGIAGLIACCFLLSIICSKTVFAGETQEHDACLESVLFGPNAKMVLDTERKKEVMKALNAASYLAIDQYNGSGKDKLETLEKNHIKNLPKSIDEINFTSNQYHREYTHRGWDHDYSKDDKGNWPVRQQILLSTVNKEFTFSTFLGSTFGYDKKCKAFSELVYYTHILKDRSTDIKYYLPKHIMDVGGRRDNDDIISNLESCIEILFEDQKSDRTYMTLMRRLKTYDNEFEDILHADGGIRQNDTGEKFQQYKELSGKVEETLIDYIPLLLKDEKFFNSVFY